MSNKKLLMALSALMILIYHLWIYVFSANNMVIFLKQICFIGVDIFFFLSAYSIGKSKKIDYKSFIKQRFSKIYLKFVVFALIAFFINKWTIFRLLKVLFGIEFFIKGGGSFLWFIPAIMILYILLPLYKKLENHNHTIVYLFSFIYILSSILISVFTKYKAPFIFTNRIPIILIGYYFANYSLMDKLRKNKPCYVGLSLLLLIIGLFISYNIFINHISLSLFNDIFYFTAIPLIISIILLVDLIPSNKVIDYLGSFTLEIYAVQMIFGYRLANYFYTTTNNAILTNILTLVSISIISLIFNKLFKLFEKKI